MSTPQSLTDLMRGGSKSFFAASRVLPVRARGPAVALYAYCRLADDVVDGQGDAPEPDELVMAKLKTQLDRIYAHDTTLPEVENALAEVVERFDIPQALLSALLEGFEWDRQGRRYETMEELQDYCARVAGTVGAMMALIMGARSEAALARACELGVAMQLTNIARDVGEDARNGRVYLPLHWLKQEGIPVGEWLEKPQFTSAIGNIVSRVLLVAENLYKRAELGIAELPRDCRPAIQAARLVYAEIGREVERAGLNSIAQRAVVSHERKLALMVRSLAAAIPHPRDARSPLRSAQLSPLPAVEFLVKAATNQANSQANAQAKAHQHKAVEAEPLKPEGNYYQRTIWAISLFERVAERQRLSY
jgi:15-cis-phytoene synthase